jgi:thioredoxin:protein disulfide reductase
MVELGPGADADGGLCVRWFRLALFIAVIHATQLTASDNVFHVTAGWRGAPQSPGGAGQVVLTVVVDPGWHVNSNVPLDPFLIPTRAALDLPPGWRSESPVFPAHEVTRLAFSEEPVAVFKGSFEILIVVHVTTGVAWPAALHGTVEAQACNDKVCLAPAEATFALPLPAAAATGGPTGPAGSTPPASAATTSSKSESETASGFSAKFASSGLLLQLALVFLAGLALNLTPCVYPLIPITIGFFVAQREASRGKTWFLAVTYVLGMSVTYSVLGIGAALSGRLFGSTLQSPWVVGALVVVLLALATSMFGLWELRVPTWATRLSGGRSGIGGSLVMGLMVGLVAAPCIGPFVLGLLTYVGQRQDVWLGFLLFFVLSLGLGLPYLLLAVFTGVLDRMPNSGAWMLGVRQLFGVLLVALAGYFARPLLPSPVGDWLFAGLLVVGGLYLLLVARPGHEQPWIDRAMRAASAAVLIAGVLLVPRAHGSGANELSWQPYDATSVERALASGRPVILDFYATWCLPCKELDEKTFSDPKVAARLNSFARFKVDLTASNPTTEAVRQRFSVVGVPTIAVFVGGHEVPAARLTGFEAPAQFLRRLDTLPAAPNS